MNQLKNNYLIYAYVKGEEVLYVGVCGNNGKRLKQHLEPGKINQQRINNYIQTNAGWNTTILKRNLSKYEALEIEKIIIEKFKPKFNGKEKE